jgi:Zn-dependent protease/CBS domain-containing protein
MHQDRAESRVSTSSGLSTFHVFGARVHLHFTFVLLLIFLLVSGFESTQSIAGYLCYVFAILASVLLHEAAHAVVALRRGIRTVEVTLFPTGGVSRFDRAPGKTQELWIGLAGPLTNFVIAGSLFGVLAWQGKLPLNVSFDHPSDSNLLEQIALGNLVLAVFNLLPAAPMDGGRILRSLLSQWQPEEAATRNAAWAGRMLAFAIALFGLLNSHFLLVFMAFFVYLGASQEGAAAVGRQLTHGIPVRAAMLTEYKTLSHGDTVRQAANLLLATAQQDFPVVHGDQVLGLLNRHALLRAMAMEGPDAYVAGVMDRDYPTLSPDLDLADVLPTMAQAGSCALVMQGEHLLGLLTSENLSQFLLLRRFGMTPAETRA